MLKIKIHDVYHDKISNEEKKKVQEALDEYIDLMRENIESCHIEWGRKNSPIFINLKVKRLTLKSAKSIASRLLEEFSREISCEINSDKIIDYNNIFIIED